MSRKKEIPAVLCEHANECPSVCPCPANCYCRRVGSAPACKPRVTGPMIGGTVKGKVFLLLDSSLFAELTALGQEKGQIVLSIKSQRRTVTFAFPDESSMSGEVVFPAGKIYLRPVTNGSFSMRAPHASSKDQAHSRPRTRRKRAAAQSRLRA